MNSSYIPFFHIILTNIYMNQFLSLHLTRFLLLGLSISLMMGCDACQTIVQTAQQNLPSRFVLVTTQGDDPAHIETRVSTDGKIWSGPNYPRTTTGAKHPSHHQIAPGIGTNTQEYMLVWFDVNGQLHSQVSDNGLDWRRDKVYGTYQVNINSRPSVVYNYTEQEWWTAFREGQEIVVRQLLSNGAGASTRISVPNIQLGISMVWTTDGFILAYRASAPGDVYLLQSPDGMSWNPAPGSVVMDISGNPIRSKGSPYLSYALGTLRLGTNDNFTAVQGFDAGKILLYRQQSNGSWELEQELERIQFNSRGVAVAGPSDNLVIAAANADHTAMWWKFQKQDALNTQTELEPCLSHGPAGQMELYNVEIRFGHYKRVPEPGNWDYGDEEDVTLEVKHLAECGQELTQMAPVHLEDMIKGTTHIWSQNTPNSVQPVFQTLLQPQEFVEIAITGDGGTVRKRLTLSDFQAGRSEISVGELPQDDAAYTLNNNTLTFSRVE